MSGAARSLQGIGRHAATGKREREQHKGKVIKMGWKGKAPAPANGKSSNAGAAECYDNGWCFTCGGTGFLAWNFGGDSGRVTCKDCGGSGKAK
jgi:DnaJ-class molecular chaperone